MTLISFWLNRHGGKNLPYFDVCQISSSGDPIYQVGALPIFIDGVTVSTPGVEQTLNTFVVAAGKTRILAKIIVSCTLPGYWVADDGSGTIATGLVGSGHPESIFEFVPRRALTASSTFSIKFTARAGPASDVHFHIMASEI